MFFATATNYGDSSFELHLHYQAYSTYRATGLHIPEMIRNLELLIISRMKNHITHYNNL